MTLWHLMFQRPNFSEQHMQNLVDQYTANPDFGGFPVQQMTLTHQTQTLFYLDFEFRVTVPINRGTFEQMVKFLLLQAVGSDQVPMPFYYGVMNQPLADLGIETHIYPHESTDIIYWRAPAQD